MYRHQHFISIQKKTKPKWRFHGFPERENEADGAEGPFSSRELAHVSLLRGIGLRLDVDVEGLLSMVKLELPMVLALLQHVSEKSARPLG